MIEFATNEVEKANFLDKEKERKKLVAKKKRDQRQARKLREENPAAVAKDDVARVDQRPSIQQIQKDCSVKVLASEI